MNKSINQAIKNVMFVVGISHFKEIVLNQVALYIPVYEYWTTSDMHHIQFSQSSDKYLARDKHDSIRNNTIYIYISVSKFKATSNVIKLG